MTKTTYFQWLCDLVHCEKHGKSYYKLLKIMWETLFIVKNKYDINRANDGSELKSDYIWDLYAQNESENITIHIDLISNCSILEMIIGISKRMAFELANNSDDELYFYHYFWEILDNLGLSWFDDDKMKLNPTQNEYRIEEILKNLNERRYKRNGVGGMFPLKWPSKNQKRVEIWYQMQEYINEKYRIEDNIEEPFV